MGFANCIFILFLFKKNHFMSSLFAVFIGGGLGAVFRFLIGKYVVFFYQGVFPLSTLIANVFSCLILSVIIFKSVDFKWLNDHVLLLLTVGFCGGLSTFSTYSLETFELLRNGSFGWAILNFVMSTLVCVSVIYVVYRKMI